MEEERIGKYKLEDESLGPQICFEITPGWDKLRDKIVNTSQCDDNTFKIGLPNRILFLWGILQFIGNH